MTPSSKKADVVSTEPRDGLLVEKGSRDGAKVDTTQKHVQGGWSRGHVHCDPVPHSGWPRSIP